MTRTSHLSCVLCKNHYPLDDDRVRCVLKTRYVHPLPDGLAAEIDVYHGPLDGLVTVEVEFPDEKRRAAFAPPAWFGKDVSQERWAKNSDLAGKRLAEIAPFLQNI